jgi:predicted nucleic acid-binding protein
MALVVDAGPLVAALDADDPKHGRCADLLESHRGPLIVPVLVAAEVAYFASNRLGTGAEVRFLGDLASGGLVAEEVGASDWERMIELVWQYQDFPLGTVDASVIAAAERLEINEIATLDRRHFGAVRPRHVDAFELLP